MSKPTYTKAELRIFDRLIDESEDHQGLRRITGRIKLREFIDKHGKEKCDAMWAELEGRKEQP